MSEDPGVEAAVTELQQAIYAEMMRAPPVREEQQAAVLAFCERLALPPRYEIIGIQHDPETGRPTAYQVHASDPLAAFPAWRALLNRERRVNEPEADIEYRLRILRAVPPDDQPEVESASGADLDRLGRKHDVFRYGVPLMGAD